MKMLWLKSCVEESSGKGRQTAGKFVRCVRVMTEDGGLYGVAGIILEGVMLRIVCGASKVLEFHCLECHETQYLFLYIIDVSCTVLRDATFCGKNIEFRYF